MGLLSFTDDIYTPQIITDAINLPAAAITSDSQVSSSAGLTLPKMAQRAIVPTPVPVTSYRKADFITSLSATAGTGYLGLAAGTWATDSPTLVSEDGASTTISNVVYFECFLLDNYDNAQTVQLRIPAVMDTVSDSTATLTVQVFKPDGNGGISANLYSGSALDINSATWANKDFAITATNLVKGDRLQVKATVAITDSATGSGVTAQLGDIKIMADLRG